MSLVRNSIWNLAGFVIPSILAIPGMAILARKLSIGEYGLFMLIFALIGYISIFDFGLNRAIIRFIAINENDNVKKQKILGTSILFLTIISLILSFLVFLLIDEIVFKLNIQDLNYDIVKNTLLLSIITIPFFLVTQCFTGYLEGLQKFKLLNIQKTITNSVLVILPVFFVLLKARVDYAIFGLMLARFLNLLIAYWFFIKFDKIKLIIDISIVKEMIFYGGWITLSNIISPIMTYFDRFVLSYFTNVTTVGYYSISTEIVTRMSIIPGSVAKALFPYMSSNKSMDKNKYYKYIIVIFLVTFLFCLPFLLFSEQIIRIWVGEKYLGVTVDVLKILILGLLFNAIAQVPFTFIQAIGLSRITALIHLSELIPYLVIMSYLIAHYGIYGAAIAWVLRMVVDFLIMHYFASKEISRSLK